MTRFTRLVTPRRARGLHLGLGLDVESRRLPPSLVNRHAGDPAGPAMAIEEFAHEAAFAVSDVCTAFKPNLAFAEGEPNHDGESALQHVLRRLRMNCKEVPIVIDGERGDIANSAQGYSERLFGATMDGHFLADAATLNPYLGYEDAMDAFLERWPDRTSFILCRTTNKGAAVIQDALTLLEDELVDQLMNDGLLDWATPAVIGSGGKECWLMPAYLRLACLARYAWNGHGNVGLVVGATAPEQLRRICQIVQGTGIELLIPGSKTQGGKLEEVIPILQKTSCLNQATIFISRAALYPKEGVDDKHWLEAIEARFRALHEEATAIAKS